MFVSAAVLVLVWAVPLVAAVVQGEPPARLETYTTFVTYAVDLGVILPATVTAGVLIWCRRALGYLIAASLLVVEALLAPLIAAQTVSQLWAGEEFTTAEVVGPMGGFVALSLVALWMLVKLLQGVAVPRANGNLAISEGQPS